MGNIAQKARYQLLGQATAVLKVFDRKKPLSPHPINIFYRIYGLQVSNGHDNDTLMPDIVDKYSFEISRQEGVREFDQMT